MMSGRSRMPNDGDAARTKEGGTPVKGLELASAILLLLASLILLVPALYLGLSAATAGRPWVQILVGIVGLGVSVAMLAGKNRREELS